MLTVATMPEGRIVRRLEATRGIAPQSLVASPDGKTLYYVNAGSLFSVDIEGGDPASACAPPTASPSMRAPRSGAHRPGQRQRRGQALPDAVVDGTSELSILFVSPLRIAPLPISGAAVGPDGRIAVTITSPDSLFRGVGLLDPVSASIERLPLVFDGDVQSPAWTRDGSLLAVGVSIRSSLWRFQATAETR